MHRNATNWRSGDFSLAGRSRQSNHPAADCLLSPASSFSDFSKYSELSDVSGLTGQTAATYEQSSYFHETDGPTRWRNDECFIEKMPHYPVRRSSVVASSCSGGVLSPCRKAPSKPTRRLSLVCQNPAEPIPNNTCRENSTSSSSSDRKRKGLDRRIAQSESRQTSKRWTDSNIKKQSRDKPTFPVRRCSVASAPAPQATPNDRWCEKNVQSYRSGPLLPSRRSSLIGSCPLQEPPANEAFVKPKVPTRAESCSVLGMDEFVPEEPLRPNFPSKQQSSGGLAPVLYAMQKSLEPAYDTVSAFANFFSAVVQSKNPPNRSVLHNHSTSTSMSKISLDSTISSAKQSILSTMTKEATESRNLFVGSSSTIESSPPIKRHWAATA